MTKMTIVTDREGKLIAAVSGHTFSGKYGDVEAQVSFPSDHKLHKVEVEDDMAKITDPAEFHKRLLKHTPKS